MTFTITTSFHPNLGDHYAVDDFKDIVREYPAMLNGKISFDMEVGTYVSKEDGDSVLQEYNMLNNQNDIDRLYNPELTVGDVLEGTAPAKSEEDLGENEALMNAEDTATRVTESALKEDEYMSGKRRKRKQTLRRKKRSKRKQSLRRKRTIKRRKRSSRK